MTHLPPHKVKKTAHEISHISNWISKNIHNNIPDWAEHKLAVARAHVGDVKDFMVKSRRTGPPGAPRYLPAPQGHTPRPGPMPAVQVGAVNSLGALNPYSRYSEGATYPGYSLTPYGGCHYPNDVLLKFSTPNYTEYQQTKNGCCIKKKFLNKKLCYSENPRRLSSIIQDIFL